jgi:fluoroquinolone transport system permease protein
MKRLIATVIADARLQLRNGFYYSSIFILAVWAAVLSQIPPLELGWLLPAIVFGNLATTTFYFVAGLVLLEKAEGSLVALVVTPLRTPEYLASKTLTLTAIALVENLILVVLFYGAGFNWGWLALGIVLASAAYVLSGFIAVSRYRAINEFLMPSVAYTAALSLPLIALLAGWSHPLLLLHPLQGALVLMRAAFESIPAPEIVAGAVSAVAWIGALGWWSRRVFARFVIAAI